MNESKPWLPMRVVGSLIGMIGMIATGFAFVLIFVSVTPVAARTVHLTGVILLIVGIYDLYILRVSGRPLTDRRLNHVCGALAVNGYLLLFVFSNSPWVHVFSGIVPIAILLFVSQVLYIHLAGRLGLDSAPKTAPVESSAR